MIFGGGESRINMYLVLMIDNMSVKILQAISRHQVTPLPSLRKIWPTKRNRNIAAILQHFHILAISFPQI